MNFWGAATVGRTNNTSGALAREWGTVFRARPRALVLVLLGSTLLSGCMQFRPEAITTAEHEQRAAADYKQVYANYVPIQGPLTLSEAVARALKYNFDAQLAKSQVSLQEQQMDLAIYQMLPRLAASAGYNWRDNDNAAESISEINKKPSLDYSYSEEPSHASASLEMSWNLLDAGVSYFQAKQQGYRAYIAIERRRKVIEDIIKGVQASYWKAVAAQRILPRLDPIVAEAQKALDNSREAASKNLQPQLEALDYQQGLLQVLGQLRHMRSDLNSARVQLAALINAPDADQLILATPDDKLDHIQTKADLPRLEEATLVQRPDLREAAYEEKIDRQDVYKEMIKMMPGIGLLGSLNYDSNKYLYNNTWGELGVRATYNLMSLITGPKAIQAANTAADIAHARREALSVAVLAQVNVSYQEYLIAVDDFNTARQISDVQRQIQRASDNATLANLQTEAEHVRRELAGLESELQRNNSATAVHSALANLYSAVGIDLVPPSADLEDLPALSKHVATALAGWESGELPDVSQYPALAGTATAAANPAAATVSAATVAASLVTQSSGNVLSASAKN